MHDALEMTVGEMVEYGICTLRAYCEKCRRLEFESTRFLTSEYGANFRVQQIVCDSCDNDSLVLSPRQIN